MTNKQHIVRVLSHLYRIVEAGEKGYAISAANVNNQGLKALLKSYALERARHKSEILAEIQRLGGDPNPRGSIRGLLHRGRINIFAALSIGREEREKVVLKEIVVGEKVALRTYANALKNELPPEIREAVARQYAEVSKVFGQVNLMRGKEGKRLLVQLFKTEEDAEEAVNKLGNAGWPRGAIERVTFGDALERYEGRGTVILETCLSGAVGGALWGNLIGALAGIGADQAVAMTSFGTDPLSGIWYYFALAGIAAGGLIGGMIGLVIGTGISEEDTYLYDTGREYGRTILMILVNVSHTSEAAMIMSQVGQRMIQTEKSPA
jgi:uncharacterized protein (TIGR02284 family)